MVNRSYQQEQKKSQSPGEIWIEENYWQLPQNQWVAANDKGLLVSDPQVDILLAQLSEEVRNQPNSYTLAFIK